MIVVIFRCRQRPVALQDFSRSPQLQTMAQWLNKLYLSSFEGLDVEWNGDFSAHSIKSMTWAGAQELGLVHRGKVRVGFAADLLIFQRLHSEQQWYKEYDLLYVLVNGHKAVINGRILLGDYGVGYYPQDVLHRSLCVFLPDLVLCSQNADG